MTFDKTGSPPELAIIIPIRNEESLLWETATTLGCFFDKVTGAGNWFFIFVDNGSTDRTPDIIRSLIEKYPLTKLLHLQPPNYGAALRTGLQMAETEFAAIVDVDQWDLPFLEWAWANRFQHELFIGSRRADPALSVRPAYRWFLSWGLNVLLQLLFDFSGTETHGPKLMNLRRLRPLIDLCESDRGQYDTEIVLRSVRCGVAIIEAPISCIDSRRPRNLMLQKLVWNIIAFTKLRYRMRNVPRTGAMVYRRVARCDVLESCSSASEEKVMKARQ